MALLKEIPKHGPYVLPAAKSPKMPMSRVVCLSWQGC